MERIVFPMTTQMVLYFGYNCFSIENTTIINFSGDNGTNQDALYGPIAPEIGLFLNLDTLDLSGNNLSGQYRVK